MAGETFGTRSGRAAAARSRSARVLPIGLVATLGFLTPVLAQTAPQPAPGLGEVPLPPRREAPAGSVGSPAPPERGERPADVAPPPTAGSAPAAAAPSADVCRAALRERGIEVSTEPADIAGVPGPAGEAACGVEDPVRLVSVAVAPRAPLARAAVGAERGDRAAAGGRRVAIEGRPLLSCAFALRAGAWIADMVVPLADGVFESPLRAIRVGGGYECRGRNRDPRAKPSAHGQGIALDLVGFGFENGARLDVLDMGRAPSDAPARRFLRAVEAAACGAFTTSLGPSSDALHADHVHVDAVPRGRNGDARYCR